MKRVITMVGTSIFDNYKDKYKDDKNFADDVEELRDKRASEFEEAIRIIDRIKNKINKWIEKERDRENISAEIKSLVKLKEELKDEFEIYLLCSDTILSKVAGEIIENFITSNIDMFNANDLKCYLIDDLQVKDRTEFSRGGMPNIIKKFYSISNGFWDDLIINITGGFKATIPYLTILGQINRCPIYYIFEATDVLIRIPHIPLDVNWRIFEEEEYKTYRIEK